MSGDTGISSAFIYAEELSRAEPMTTLLSESKHRTGYTYATLFLRAT